MGGARGCCVLIALVGLLILPQATPVSRNAEIVQGWADVLGEELWRLTVKLTNIDEIKRRYVDLHIKVRRKNETSILNSAVGSVTRMLQRKIDAVKCIHHQAEEVARNYSRTPPEDKFKYCSSKYSCFTRYNDTEPEPEPDPDDDEKTPQNCTIDIPERRQYVNVTLNEDSHFYDIFVDTSGSCVQVPTNIYDQEADAKEAILWSQRLDETFLQNYESDPSLSWQYFGSSTGILRLYPGMPWQTLRTDVFDCRVRSWYIEAATCSKDVIILFDVSGSMTGFRNYVARATLKTLLETLSNNDFINVYTFKNETREAVGCFTDLVQATPENLKTITDELEPTEGGKKHKVPLEGYANLTTAYITAFEKLKIRRQNCSTLEENQGCNQLVMLITDNVPGNLTEVFDNYNRERDGNETRIPVRVFTYLIGKEVTNVREIQWMACLNRGYYVHIHSIEEVQQQVLKYINVIARPMILEGAEPPPTWTHAYIDETRTNTWGVSKQISMADSDKLVTSVAIPAFKFNESGDNVTRAELLGVAGTDVPIDSITKLAQPHQLGVNGYSFIVSNNGYLLLHPFLVPSIDGRLQMNLNSVDIVEVEQVDDGLSARQLGDLILRLRSAMVNGESGHLMGIPVLFHYDKMRRIAQVNQNYFYNKLEGTPFSLGISLPEGYGNTYLDVDEGDIWEMDFGGYIGTMITRFFNSSYRVHPDWVYCKYHYLEDHEKESPEQEVWHFLRKMNEKGWKWSEQYSNEAHSSQQFSRESCTQRAKLDKEDYYCNRDLVQMLVFDAKLTDPSFKEWAGSAQELEMAKLYNVTVRFVSTSSGLTRWNYLFDNGRNEVVDDDGHRRYIDPHLSENDKSFGDIYPRAIEETWYMSAVLQHVISDETLVVAVNFIADEGGDKGAGNVSRAGNETRAGNDTRAGNESRADNITVTASYAIFARQHEEESPASVVGLQFQYANWRERFKRVTEHTNIGCGECIERCDAASGVACYLIDSSGYVVMAEEPRDVSKFFGVRQPYVMRHMTKKTFFKEKIVYDYQALCGPEDLNHNSSAGAAWRLTTPLRAAEGAARWLMLQLAWLVTDVLAAVASMPQGEDYDYAMYPDHNDPPTAPPTTPSPSTKEGAKDDNTQPEELLFSCDKEVKLYILQTENMTGGIYEKPRKGLCTPYYIAVKVKHTNLLFVAVDTRGWAPMPFCATLPMTTDKIPTDASTQSKIPCHKLDLGGLERRRLEGCYTYHKKEAEIDACGGGSVPRPHLAPLLAALLFTAAAVVAARPLLP